jgi:hypothetical protein
MFGRMANINAMIAAFLPFSMGIAICKCWFKYKARGSKDMEVLGPNRTVGHCEGVIGTFFSGIGS